MPDHLTLYDGDLYNRTVQPIVKIRVDPNNDDERYLHKTAKSNAMSVKFHATGSRDSLGFVAEVVTLPMSVVGLNRYGHKFIFRLIFTFVCYTSTKLNVSLSFCGCPKTPPQIHW